MISSVLSRLIGAAVSLFVGWIVWSVVEAFVGSKLNFWYLGEVLGPAVGLTLGGMAAFALYITSLKTVPINYVGVLKIFGAPTGIMFGNGDHWIPFFCGIQVVPGPEMPDMKDMPGEIIACQDGNTIYFGVAGDGVDSNALEYYVLDASRYLKAPKAVQMLRKEWLSQGRLFFSQLATAAGVNSVKMLFEDFIALPAPCDEDGEYAAFETRLANATFGSAKGRLFSDEAVIAIRASFGNIAREAAVWGIGDLDAQAPNIRQNPTADTAAASKITREAELENLEARANKFIDLTAKARKETRMSPDLAAAAIASLDGRSLGVQHFSFSGLNGVGNDAKGRIASELVEKRGNNNGKKE